MALKLITIDFWNTIYDSSSGVERNNYRISALKRQIEGIGEKFNHELVENTMKKSWEYFNKIWKSEMRTPSPRATVEYFWKELNYIYDKNIIDELEMAFSEAVLVHPPKLIFGVKESLEKLNNNFKLGIISDTGFSPGIYLKKLLKKTEILDYFSDFSFSDETGVSKPHAKAYEKILNTLNFSPKEALHIGDIESTDIIGAKQVGMRAIRFSGDNTAIYNFDNTMESIADAEFKDWNDIIEYIEKIKNI